MLLHEFCGILLNNRDFYKDIDLIIAECSYPTIGLGIELGWTFDDNIPVYCIHKQETKVSGINLCNFTNIFEYIDIDEMLKNIENIVMKNDKKQKLLNILVILKKEKKYLNYMKL